MASMMAGMGGAGGMPGMGGAGGMGVSSWQIECPHTFSIFVVSNLTIIS